MRTWSFPSSSSPKPHTTTLSDNGLLSCTCKGWTFRRGEKPRECTHIKDVLVELGTTRIVKGEYIFTDGIPVAGAAPVVAPVPAEVLTPTDEDAAWQDTKAAERVGAAAAGGDMRAPACQLASGMTTRVEGAAFDAKYGTGEWTMDEKLDGHRLLLVKRGDRVAGWARGATDTSEEKNLPAHVIEAARQLPDCILDCEFVVPGGNSWNVVEIERQDDLVLIAFDILEVQGVAGQVSVMGLPQTERRELLLVALSQVTSDALMPVAEFEPTWANAQAVWARGGEGCILKRKTGVYRPGYRTDAWVKVVQEFTTVVTITGFKPGSFGPHAVTLISGLAGVKSVKTKNNATLARIAQDGDAAWIGRRLVVSHKMRGGRNMHAMWDHEAGDGE